jgi:transketolase
MTENPIAKRNSPFRKLPLNAKSIYLRKLIIDALAGGGGGHIGSSMSLVEILSAIYETMNHKPTDPEWPGRDRCILSKGHGCLALYAVLADQGYFPKEWLKTFTRPESPLGGHPERGKVPGVEASTGSLGHGLSIGIGIAQALRMKKNNASVYVVMGDGEINEGSVWEGAMHASHLKLDNLFVFIDYNKIQSAGPTEQILDLEPLENKWRAFGFATYELDGHDIIHMKHVMNRAHNKEYHFNNNKPRAIICHTIKGRGLDIAEHDPEWHHKANLDAGMIQSFYDSLERGN